MKKHRYTEEQIQFIREIAEGKHVEEIQKVFNDKYKVDVTFKSIKGVMYRNGIKNKMQGVSTRFKKGQTSWCKGMKGLNLGGNKGWFKEGNTPPSHKPVGSETLKDGWVMIKVAEPNVWRKKHHHIWEQEHGEIPDGMVLRFKDGNKLNVTLDNLFMTPAKAMTSVVRRGLENDHPELQVTTHRVAELELAIKDKQKELTGS